MRFASLQVVRIDHQIRAHVGQQVAANLLLAILQGGEFVAEKRRPSLPFPLSATN